MTSRNRSGHEEEYQPRAEARRDPAHHRIEATGWPRLLFGPGAVDKKGAFVARRFVDLSVALEQGIASDPPTMLPRIDYRAHRETAAEMAFVFPGLTADQLPGGEGWAVETLTVSTHNGTHLDAPYHFHSTMNDGERAITIDEVPLDWCFAPGVKLDFRGFPDGYVATAADVAAELDRIGHRLKPLDIVLVNTSAGARYGEADYLARGCGMGREATLHLLERGVRVTGTDAWSWDAPFLHTARRFAVDPRSVDHLGRPPGRHEDRLLPPREACQSRGVAGARIHRCLLSLQDQRRLGRIHPRRRHPRRTRDFGVCARGGNHKRA